MRRARPPASAGGAPTRSANTTSRSSSATPSRPASTATLCTAFSPFSSGRWPISRSASRASWSRSLSSSLSSATVRSSCALAPGPGAAPASSRCSSASIRAAPAEAPLCTARLITCRRCSTAPTFSSQRITRPVSSLISPYTASIRVCMARTSSRNCLISRTKAWKSGISTVALCAVSSNAGPSSMETSRPTGLMEEAPRRSVTPSSTAARTGVSVLSRLGCALTQATHRHRSLCSPTNVPWKRCSVTPAHTKS
ncbi:uncharacterized protein LOC135084120 [Ostrinia nubilalis]|uniref:uncharacterized protein LOC135084120 n=1 Tax=Ostrinia nubilalis TaxID=29057 RepID=UPI003082402D